MPVVGSGIRSGNAIALWPSTARGRRNRAAESGEVFCQSFVASRRARVSGRSVPLGSARRIARPVERRDDHLAVGALDRQEPVLQVAGVVVLVHADAGRGVAEAQTVDRRKLAVWPAVAVARRRHARPVEGPQVAAVEHERRCLIGSSDHCCWSTRRADVIAAAGRVGVGSGSEQVRRPRRPPRYCRRRSPRRSATT